MAIAGIHHASGACAHAGVRYLILMQSTSSWHLGLLLAQVRVRVLGVPSLAAPRPEFGGGRGRQTDGRYCVQRGREGTYYGYSNGRHDVLIAQESTQPQGSASMQFTTSCKGESQ